MCCSHLHTNYRGVQPNVLFMNQFKQNRASKVFLIVIVMASPITSVMCKAPGEIKTDLLLSLSQRSIEVDSYNALPRLEIQLPMPTTGKTASESLDRLEAPVVPRSFCP